MLILVTFGITKILPFAEFAEDRKMALMSQSRIQEGRDAARCFGSVTKTIVQKVMLRLGF